MRVCDRRWASRTVRRSALRRKATNCSAYSLVIRATSSRSALVPLIDSRLAVPSALVSTVWATVPAVTPSPRAPAVRSATSLSEARLTLVADSRSSSWASDRRKFDPGVLRNSTEAVAEYSSSRDTA